jgi:hypothetical protein
VRMRRGRRRSRARRTQQADGWTCGKAGGDQLQALLAQRGSCTGIWGPEPHKLSMRQAVGLRTRCSTAAPSPPLCCPTQPSFTLALPYIAGCHPPAREPAAEVAPACSLIAGGEDANCAACGPLHRHPCDVQAPGECIRPHASMRHSPQLVQNYSHVLQRYCVAYCRCNRLLRPSSWCAARAWWPIGRPDHGVLAPGPATTYNAYVSLGALPRAMEQRRGLGVCGCSRPDAFGRTSSPLTRRCATSSQHCRLELLLLRLSAENRCDHKDSERGAVTGSRRTNL